MKAVLISILCVACLLQAQIPVRSGSSAPTTPTIPYVPLVQSAGTDCIFALHTDTIAGLSCANTAVDGTTETAFTNGVTIPANYLSNNTITVNSAFFWHTTSTTPTAIFRLRLGGIGGTLIYQSSSETPSSVDAAASFICTVSALGVASSTTPLIASCAQGNNIQAPSRNNLISTTTLAIATNVTTAKVLVWTIQFSAATTNNAIGLYTMYPY